MMRMLHGAQELVSGRGPKEWRHTKEITVKVTSFWENERKTTNVPKMFHEE